MGTILSRTWPVDDHVEEYELAIATQAALVVWHEAVMAHKDNINCVDRTFQDFRDDKRAFGGYIVVFFGDFRQVLPVVPGGSRAQVVLASIKYADYRTLGED